MRKKINVLFLFLFTSGLAAGWEFTDKGNFRNSFGVTGSYFFESNAITNSFALAYFNNEFIDNQKKDNVSDKLSTSNRLGAGFQTSFNYTRYNDTLFGLSNSFYSFSLKNNYHLNSRFSPDAFEVYFRGNKMYAGKNANLGDFLLNQLVFQQATFTFGHEFLHEKNLFGFSMGVSLNKGQQFLEIEAPEASLYTEKNGEYLDLATDIDIHRSDSGSTTLFSWKGTGASLDFSLFWKDNNNNKLFMNVSNAGFIHWNKESSFIHADTSFRFEGIDISDIFLLTDSIREPISLDSSLVEPYLTERVKQNHTSKLPCLFSIGYKRNFLNEKIFIEAGISNLFFADSKIKERMTIGYNFQENQSAGLVIVNGGYAGLRAGIICRFTLFQRWELGFESDCLSEILRPNGMAQGAFLSLSAHF